MLSQSQITFLQEKIMELKQALFFNTSETVLKLPTSVINVLHTDSVGQVWFLVHRPIRQITEYERNIPAKLEFYKKGAPFYLHVTGKASIITDPEEINIAENTSADIRQQHQENMMIVKLKITDIHYFPLTEMHPSGKAYSAFVKTLQYIVKDIVPVFQAHRNPNKTRSNIHLHPFLFR